MAGRPTRPVTLAQRRYVMAFELWLRRGWARQDQHWMEVGDALMRCAIRPVLAEAGLKAEPWHVLGRPRVR